MCNMAVTSHQMNIIDHVMFSARGCRDEESLFPWRFKRMLFLSSSGEAVRGARREEGECEITKSVGALLQSANALILTTDLFHLAASPPPFQPLLSTKPYIGSCGSLSGREPCSSPLGHSVRGVGSGWGFLVEQRHQCGWIQRGCWDGDVDGRGASHHPPGGTRVWNQCTVKCSLAAGYNGMSFWN